MSRKTKIAVGLSTAGVVAAGFGAASSASAETRTLTVTLAGGTVLQVNVDVPPGTPIDQIPLPDLGGLVVKVTGPGPATTPAPTTEAAPATPTAPTPATPSPTTTDASPATPAKRKPSKAKKEKEDAAASEGSTGKKGSKARKARRAAKAAAAASAASGGADTGPDGTTTRDAGGAPTPADPTFSEAIPGPAPRGVPNFFIDKFRIPPFLLPIYQAAGVQYDVPWEILAAINEIETDYGRNLNISSAGAQGWMQFMPATWKGYGVDANNDGAADPYNPVDAIFAAARYLRAAGAQKNIKKAIFAYNHADWYVDSVLLRARLIGGLPPDLVGSLTGLTQGVFPISAKARYAGDDTNAKARARTKKGRNAARAIESTRRKSTNIFSRAGAAAVAVQDGRIVKVGKNPRLGRFVQLRDVYGNTYTYGNLKTVADFYPVPKRGAMKAAEKAEARRKERIAKAKDPVPDAPASAGRQEAPAPTPAAPTVADTARGTTLPGVTSPAEPLFANPARTMAKKHGGAEQLAEAGLRDGTSKVALQGWDKDDVTLKRLRKGAKVMAGTVLGRIGKTKATSSPHLQFEVHPGGKGSPRVDPKPILDGWKLLESTAVYRAKGANPLFGDGEATAGQVLLMSKEQLQQRVLQNRNLGIYEEGRRDIASGAIDRRVLATMEYLTAQGLRLTISSLRSGHSYRSKSGNVSEHSSGNAMDIASVNGITISRATQGKGSITDSTIRQLLQLQGTMKPHQIISLMTPADFPGADNILPLPDHDDHIHVGFRPQGGTSGALGKQVQQLLEPGQWIKLIDRIGEIANPEVSPEVSKSAIRTKKPGGDD